MRSQIINDSLIVEVMQCPLPESTTERKAYFAEFTKRLKVIYGVEHQAMCLIPSVGQITTPFFEWLYRDK